MDDDRIWEFESALWHGGRDVYEAQVDADACLMALPAAPWFFAGREAIDAVDHTPRWASVEFADQRVSRPQEGWIVIAYRVTAARPDDGGNDTAGTPQRAYEAHCTSVLRRIAHDEWRVVQHQQTPLGVSVARD